MTAVLQATGRVQLLESTVDQMQQPMMCVVTALLPALNWSASTLLCVLDLVQLDRLSSTPAASTTARRHYLRAILQQLWKFHDYRAATASHNVVSKQNRCISFTGTGHHNVASKQNRCITVSQAQVTRNSILSAVTAIMLTQQNKHINTRQISLSHLHNGPHSKPYLQNHF